MKPSRDIIKTHFSYSWLGYLGILAAAVTLWIMVFSGMLRTQPFERLEIFLVEVAFEEEDLENAIMEHLTSDTDRRLDYVNVEPGDATNSQFAHVLGMRAAAETDFIIMREDALIENTGRTYFAPIEMDVAEAFFGDSVEYYIENGDVYAIVLGGKGSGSNFSKYLDEGMTQNYYLFFSAHSENTGGMYHSNKNNDFALKAAAWLAAKE